MLADIFPGARVLESGVGSGALSMTLLRAGADVTGYELRDDFANRAPAQRRRRSSATRRWSATGSRSATATRASTSVDLDRIVLDLPEPWRVVKHAGRGAAPRRHPRRLHAADHPGGRSCARRWTASGFGMAETIEVLNRSWHIEGQSVRPDHRMVAHTGFLTSARLLVAPGARPRWRACTVNLLDSCWSCWPSSRPSAATAWGSSPGRRRGLGLALGVVVGAARRCPAAAQAWRTRATVTVLLMAAVGAPRRRCAHRPGARARRSAARLHAELPAGAGTTADQVAGAVPASSAC